jgi:hypothetical protein
MGVPRTSVEVLLAEGVGFEPTRERNPLPVFKTGALNHSATLPYQRNQKLTHLSDENDLGTLDSFDPISDPIAS